MTILGLSISGRVALAIVRSAASVALLAWVSWLALGWMFAVGATIMELTLIAGDPIWLGVRDARDGRGDR